MTKTSPRKANRKFWTAVFNLVVAVGFAFATQLTPARAEDSASAESGELVTEPEFAPEPPPTPAPRARQAKAPLAEGLPFGLNRPRSYGGGQPLRRSAAPPVRQPVRERELANEPLYDESAEPAPTPTPARKPGNPNAKQYSFTGAPAAAPAPAPSGRTDPALLDAVPPGGRELATEPLGEGAAAAKAPSAAEVGFRGELDHNHVHLDESFTWTLELQVGDLASASAVRFVKPAQFDLINTHQNESRTTQAGRMLQNRTYSYVFLPLQTGSFTLPPAEITYRGRVYKTTPLEVTVEGPRSGFAFQRQFSGRKGQQPKMLPAAPDTAASGPENTATFFANLDQREVWVNQQVTLTIRLRYLSEFGLKVAYQPPPLTGFLSEPLQQTQTETNVSGSRQKYLERVHRTAIFPIQAGSLTVSSAQVVFTKWGQNQELRTEPLSLEVKPLPADRGLEPGEPASGLVGHYNLLADLPLGRAEVESPLRLRLTLKGEGDIRAAPEPFLVADPSLRLQFAGKTEQLNRDNGVVQGERQYQYLLVPRKPGPLELGRARVRYFDPQRGAWQAAECRLPAVTVAPKPLQDSAPVRAEAPEPGARQTIRLRPIHGGQDVLRRLDRSVLEQPAFWAWPGAGVLALGLAALIRRRQQRQLLDPQLSRARRAYGQARAALQEAHGHMRKGAVSRFYDCVSRAATEYLASKFGVSAAYIVADRLNEYFDRFQVPNALRAHFKITLTACEYVRFAAMELPSHDMRSLHRDISAAIEDYERYWRKASAGRKPRNGAAALGLFLALTLAAAGARAGDPELYFLRGNTAFEQGQYETALAEYEKVIALGIADPDVYYNLGNTYIRLGRLGRAILAYEKGLRLAPRDPDLRQNLAQAAAAAVDAQPEESTLSYRGAFTRLYRILTANELAWAAALAALVLGLAAALWLVFPLRAAWWRRAAYAAGIALVLAGGWSAVRQAERVWWRRAVILAPTVEILGRPFADAEKMYTLHEGTRVAIGREEEAWVEVRFGSGRRGWCARGALGMIE